MVFMTFTHYSKILLLFLCVPCFADTSPKYQLQAITDTKEAGSLNYMIGDLYQNKRDINNNNFTATGTVSAGQINVSTVMVSNLSVSGSINTQGKHWEIIFSTYIGTPLTSYTITGLTGNSDLMYKLNTWLGGTSTGDDFAIRFNGDTGSNYANNRIYSNGATISPQAGTATCIYWANTNASPAITEGTIYAKASGILNLWRSVVYTGGSASLYYMSGVGNWNNNADNITSITIFTVSGGTSKITGYIALWALR